MRLQPFPVLLRHRRDRNFTGSAQGSSEIAGLVVINHRPQGTGGGYVGGLFAKGNQPSLRQGDFSDQTGIRYILRPGQTYRNQLPRNVSGTSAADGFHLNSVAVSLNQKQPRVVLGETAHGKGLQLNRITVLGELGGQVIGGFLLFSRGALAWSQGLAKDDQLVQRVSRQLIRGVFGCRL